MYLTSHRHPHYCLLHTIHYIQQSHTACEYLLLLGESHVFGSNVRSTLDKDALCLVPKTMWRQKSLGRISVLLRVNFSSFLFPSSAFSISFRTSWSIACRITHQHSLSCNGIGRNTNFTTVTHYTLQVGVTLTATA